MMKNKVAKLYIQYTPGNTNLLEIRLLGGHVESRRSNRRGLSDGLDELEKLRS